MDAALLLIGKPLIYYSCFFFALFSKFISFLILCYWILAGNESCPQPQTSEHLAAIEIMKLKHIVILQNKIDLVKEAQAKEQYEQILKFIQGILFVIILIEFFYLVSTFIKIKEWTLYISKTVFMRSKYIFL